MAVYLIGDVQGCFDELQRLLNKINFNPRQDRLGFVGDLVNRGPKSLATLRFIKNLNNPIVVLGNHDLHLLAAAYGIISPRKSDTFIDILQAKDCDELIDWLRQQPLIHQDEKLNYVLVHAGIPPQWNIDQALMHAAEVQNALQENPKKFLAAMHGNQPAEWQEELTGMDRLRYITNALTRMRFCTAKGELDLVNKTNHSDRENFKPWFLWREPKTDIIFGHWAAIEGKTNRAGFYALDTGCVWGKYLTALRVEDRQEIVGAFAERP